MSSQCSIAILGDTTASGLKSLDPSYSSDRSTLFHRHSTHKQHICRLSLAGYSHHKRLKKPLSAQPAQGLM